MAISGLTTFTPIAENSDATPGLFNRLAQNLQDQIDTIGSNATVGNVLGWSTNTVRPESGNTTRVLNGANLIARSYDSGGAVYNVRAFGAVGDDSTDDTISIRSAIAAVPSAGGIVYFPPGTYRITSALTMKSGLALKGAGNASSEIKQMGNVHAIVARSTNGARNLTIQDLFINDGLVGSRTSGNGIELDAGSNAVSVCVDRVGVTGFLDGFRASDIITSRLFQLRSNSALRNGIGVYGPTTSLAMDVCYANSAASHGIYFAGGAHYTSLHACVADTNGGDAYHFGRDGSLVCTFLTLNSCGAEGNVGHGFYFRDGYGHVLNACTASITTGTTKDGFRFDGTIRAVMFGGEAHRNTGYSVNVLTSATPTTPESIVIIHTNFSQNSLGNINDPNAVVTTLGVEPANQAKFKNLSIRTVAASAVTASAASQTVRVDEALFTIGGASGASLAIQSGGTIYIFNSALSAKAT